VKVRATTSRRAASEVERAQRFLAGPGAAMLSSIDRDEVLRATVDSCAGPYADLCIVDLLDTEGELQRAAAGFASAEMAARMGADFQGRRRRLQASGVLARLLADGRPQRIPALDEAWLDELDLKKMPRGSPDQPAPAAILVPLRARGRSLGLLMLVSARPERGLAASDMAVAEIYGSRVAMALDNARLYQETQRAVRLREEVLAVVAHDLRNLLNTMKAGVHLLLEIELPPEGRARHLTSLSRASDRMNHLIADLLDMSRMESGMLTVERVPLSPAGLVDEAAEQMRPLADAAQVRLHVEAEADLPAILGDPERLLRVIFNLVTNAIRYSPADGSIRLIVSRRSDSVRMGVADEGPGIPDDELPSLFTPFWQSERRSRGTAGLGLAIAGAIVELHGGAISVETSEGTGSTFWIDLPAADVEAAPGIPVDAHDSAATGN
jgi:signal transduction histidine kinase